MARKFSKFSITWSLILFLVATFQIRHLITQYGYSDLNAFSADALHYVLVYGTSLVLLCAFIVWRSRRAAVRESSSPKAPATSKIP